MPSASSPCCTRSKCVARLVAQVLGDLRRVLDHVLPVVALASRARAAGSARPAHGTRRRARRRGRAGTRAASRRSAGRLAASPIEFSSSVNALEPEVAVEAVGERDDLDVDVGIVDAEHLDADLPVLAVAALLRALVAEVRREVPDLPRHRRVVLHERAHDRRGALGPQREAAAALVLELVHLLAHDVGGLADPLEHLEVLEDRRDHEPEPEALGARRERRDQRLPPLRLRRQDVVGARRRAELRLVVRAQRRRLRPPAHGTGDPREHRRRTGLGDVAVRRRRGRGRGAPRYAANTLSIALDRHEDRVEVAGVGELELEPQLGDAVGSTSATCTRGCSRGAPTASSRDVAAAGWSGRAPRPRPTPTNVAGWSWSHSTSMRRSACADEAGGVRAVGAVHRHAAAAGDEAHDLVARHRRAAPRQAHHDVVEAFDVHAGARGARGDAGASGGRAAVTGSCSSPPRSSRWRRCTTPLADTWPSPIGGVQRVEVGVVHRLRDLEQRLRRGELLHRQALAPERLRQLLPPGVDGVDAPLTREPLADLRAWPSACARTAASRGSGPHLRPCW